MATTYALDGPGFEKYPSENVPKRPYWLWGRTQPSIQPVNGTIVKLTTHVYLVPRLSYASIPPYLLPWFGRVKLLLPSDLRAELHPVSATWFSFFVF
jgi:hypothetical protein